MLKFVMSRRGTPSCVLGASNAEFPLGNLELLDVRWDEEQQDWYVTLGFEMPGDLMVLQLPPGTAEQIYTSQKPFMFINMTEEQQARVAAAQEEVRE